MSCLTYYHVLWRTSAEKPHKASMSHAAPQQGGAFPEDQSEQEIELLVGMRAAIVRLHNKMAQRTLEGRGELMEWEQE